jgi:hypothetical protein
MATQTPGIQQLLAAEKRAADIVAEARKSKISLYFIYLKQLYIYEVVFYFNLGRTQLLKKAKEEASHEVEAFKHEKEKQYKSLEQQVKRRRNY